MKIKLTIVQLVFMVLLVGDLQGQQKIDAVLTRARLYEPMIAAAATRYGIDAHLLWTIAYLESSFRPNAISYKDGKPCAYGLMQFVPATARRYGLSNPHDPHEAVHAAARYVRDLLERFEGRADLVLAAYNAGQGTVEAFGDGKRLVLANGKVINPNGIRTGGIPPYAETRQYVARGRVVYQKIARKGFFPTVPQSIKARGRVLVETKTEPFVPATKTSIYVLNLGKPDTNHEATTQKNESVKRAESRSFYAN